MWWDIFVSVVLPVLAVVGLGALLQRGFPLHVPTLSRMAIYLLTPAFLFIRIYESDVTWSQIGSIAVVVLVPMMMLGVPLYAVLRTRKAQGSTIAAVVIGGLVYNAGYFGIPVAELLYQSQGAVFAGMKRAQDGVAVQALVVMMSNLSIWVLGYAALALAKGDGLRGALGYFKLPMIYVIVAAFVLRDTGTPLPGVVGHSVRMLAAATVPVMLLTLGAQLAQRARWPRWKLVLPTLGVKLFILPAVTAAVVIGLDVLGWEMWPWPGAQLIIAAAAPTAINTLLLTLEMDGDADLAADCVFWTTLASSVTVSGVIALLLAL